MATRYNDQVFLSREYLLDAKWGPFESTDAAKAAVDPAYRSIGLFAIIAPPGGIASLYWYQNNTTDLVPFTGNSSVEVYDVKDATVPSIPGETFFPLIGSINVIYIDKSTSSSYYWNTSIVPAEYTLTGSGEGSVEIYPSFTGSDPGVDSFPTIGVANVIYIANDTNISYIWNGIAYEALTNLDKNKGISYYTASNTDAYTVSGITTYNVGDTYLIKFTNPNTGNSSLNGYTLVNSKTNNSDLVSGDIRINETHLIVFDDDDLFQVLTIGPDTSLRPDGGAGGGSGAIVDMGDRLDGLELVDMGSRI
jgi:hypothetical protein